MLGCGLNSLDSTLGLGAGSYKQDNEPSGSIKAGQFLGNLKDLSLSQKGSAPWTYL
jgi:hypothetical protein